MWFPPETGSNISERCGFPEERSSFALSTSAALTGHFAGLIIPLMVAIALGRFDVPKI
jgi:hypothetical protein